MRRLLGKRVVQVLRHLALDPDLLQLRNAEPSLRLPRLVGAAAASLALRPGGGPSPSPLHAVPGPGIARAHGSHTHADVSLDLARPRRSRPRNGSKLATERKLRRIRWMV
jgi:hypothetical protein